MKIRQIFVAIMVWWLAVVTVPAQASGPLTPDLVQGFIAAAKEIQKIAGKYDEMLLMNQNISADAAMAKAQAPFTSAIAQMQGHQAYNEILAVIESQGFADPQQWAATGDRIMKAFVANKMASQMPQIDEQMKQAVEQIEKSNMSASQKEAMLQMIQSSAQMAGAYIDVPDADKSAVLPFMTEIETLGEN